jgi:hypothetical protein
VVRVFTSGFLYALRAGEANPNLVAEIPLPGTKCESVWFTNSPAHSMMSNNRAFCRLLSAPDFNETSSAPCKQLFTERLRPAVRVASHPLFALSMSICSKNS